MYKAEKSFGERKNELKSKQTNKKQELFVLLQFSQEMVTVKRLITYLELARSCEGGRRKPEQVKNSRVKLDTTPEDWRRKNRPFFRESDEVLRNKFRLFDVHSSPGSIRPEMTTVGKRLQNEKKHDGMDLI